MSIHFLSKTPEWRTPLPLYQALHKRFSFTLDPCCSDGNALCGNFYTKEADGLTQDWSKHRVFMNPPYGREIGKWVQKAYEESQKGALVVCLLPARVDTKWWHDYCTKGDIRFIKGRLKFSNSEGIGNPAPFPSAIVIFYGWENITSPQEPTNEIN